MTESARQRIRKAVEQLRTPDRVAISCTVLVRPVGMTEEYPCDGEVIDRWTVDEHTDECVKVECVIESYSEQGQEQYDGIKFAIEGCEDLLPIPQGKDPTHFMIENLIFESPELNQKKDSAWEQGIGHEITGPHLFFQLRRMLKKTAHERPPDFSRSTEWAHLLSWLYEQGVQPDGRNMQAFLSAFKQYKKQYRGIKNGDGKLLRIP
ncbi:MAG: hypothetical protein ABGZ35_25285, partial [Planctomycetaceae bacterium]